jgi:hypothetical protein
VDFIRSHLIKIEFHFQGNFKGPLAIPQLKKQKRVGRFFWKNLEAKPLNFEPA